MTHRPTYILGVSAFYHDASAALLCDGVVVAAVQEERLSRIKGDASFPSRAIRSCLAIAGIDIARVDHAVFFEKPWLHLERLLETFVATAPRSARAFLAAMPPWLGEKLHVRRAFRAVGWRGPVLYTEHHEAHQASAFYPSPFDEAAILTVDGVGEWATASVAHGRGASIVPLGELHFPHSIGLLYSAFTSYLGFEVDSGEYKVMGLAPYGEPTFRDTILREVVDLREDGSLRLDLSLFAYHRSLTMTSPAFHALFGGPPRARSGPLEQRHLDIARSIQVVTEEILLRMARFAHARTGARNLVLSGGVALNCVANGRILREGPFDDVWIQPAAGDAGSALGAALAVWHRYLDHPRPTASGDRQRGSYLGPSFTSAEVAAVLEAAGACSRVLAPDALAAEVARLIFEGAVIGVLQGRMEFGPRALGHRSILADARSPVMQRVLNEKVKRREGFRPFAPAVLAERAPQLFALDRPSPYMLLTVPVTFAVRLPLTPEQRAVRGLAMRDVPRSTLPAVTHVDGSSRIQTVDGAHSAGMRRILLAVEARTGVGCVVNTSFNIKDEPIVATPLDAWRCFAGTGIDALVVEDRLLLKEEQDEAALQAGRAPLPAPLVPLGRRMWRGWLAGSQVVGTVMMSVLLAVLMLFVMTPLGLIRRAMGKDSLGETPRDSYWRPRPDDPRGPEKYTHRF